MARGGPPVVSGPNLKTFRSKTDTGIVVILDSGIAAKFYGAKFLAAIRK